MANANDIGITIDPEAVAEGARRYTAEKRLRELSIEQAAHSAAADDVITIASMLPVWDGRAYIEGAIVQHKGLPYQAIRDIAANPTWDPEIGAPSEWRQYHGRTRETALPYKKEGHNPYQRGEWAVWMDGAAYECTMDNAAWSPGEYPQAWRVYRPETAPVVPGDEEQQPAEEWPQWVQGVPGDPAKPGYPMDAKVSDNGKHWVCSQVGGDGLNWYRPGVWGWKQG